MTTSRPTAQRGIAVALALAACSGSAAPAAPGLSVDVSPPVAMLLPGETQTFVGTVTGTTGDTRVNWSVAEGGTGGSVLADGTYTAPGATGTFHVVATSRADPNRSATAVVLVSTPGSGWDYPAAVGGKRVALVSPTNGETFVGSSIDLRFVGVGWYLDTVHQADSVEFIVDGVTVLSTTSHDYWVFKGSGTRALSPGLHSVVARAHYADGSAMDSPVSTIVVQAAPSYGTTYDLTADTVLSTMATMVGTSSSPIRVNGNGHRIYDNGSATSVNWQYVDFYDMGPAGTPSTNGIDITTTGNVTIQNCRFDYSNPLRFSLGGTATANVRSNSWRSNMREPLGQNPYPGDSYPVINFTGTSSGTKVFAGNNVASGWVDFQRVNHWTVGGDTDADSNVMIGPRVGVFFDYMGGNGASSYLTIKKNILHHVYFGGWSQGNLLQMGYASNNVLVEHNVLAGSSWPIRDLAAEFRYNLTLHGNEAWVWPRSGANIHHNVFVGEYDCEKPGLFIYGGQTNVAVRNNTFDAQGHCSSGNLISDDAAGVVVDSNVFYRMGGTHPAVAIPAGSTADYNLFWAVPSAYSPPQSPAHDIAADPRFTSPSTHHFEWDPQAVWSRAQAISSILGAYRARYTPQPASPLVDAGNTAVYGAGNDIGAVGSGASNVADLFGR